MVFHLGVFIIPLGPIPDKRFSEFEGFRCQEKEVLNTETC